MDEPHVQNMHQQQETGTGLGKRHRKHNIDQNKSNYATTAAEATIGENENIKNNTLIELEDFKKLPTVEGDKDINEIVNKQPTMSYSAMNCVICLDILLENETAKLMCGHKFHTHCIMDYTEEKAECPLCRKKIVR
eukprot:UN09598